MNPKATAIGNPTDPSPEGCAWKLDAVLLSAWIAWSVMSVRVLFAASSIGIHLTSNHPLYDKYERATTNNPTIIAASLITEYQILLQTEILHPLKNNTLKCQLSQTLLC